MFVIIFKRNGKIAPGIRYINECDMDHYSSILPGRSYIINFSISEFIKKNMSVVKVPHEI